MDLLKIARIAKQSTLVLIAAALVGAIMGAAVGYLGRSNGTDSDAEVFYSATETLGYDADASGPSALGGSSALATVGSFVTGPSVTDQVGRKLADDGVDLARQITTVARPTSNSIDVSAFAETPARAEKLARTFSRATQTLYAEELAARSEDQANQLSKRLDDLKARRTAVEAQLGNPNLTTVDRDVLSAQSDALVNQYRIAYDRFINLASPDTSATPLFTLGSAKAISIDAATYRAALERGRTGQNHLVADSTTDTTLTAESSSSDLPSGPIGWAVLGALVGLAVGSCIILLRARLDSKLRDRVDFEEAFGLPILGGVPVLARDEQSRHLLSVIEKPYSPGAEVFRAVRSALLLLGTDDPDRSGALIVMVSSAQPKEGKSATCANLAVAFAESGRNVLAVNCDYRRPTLHRYFGLTNEPGGIQSTDVSGLSVVTNVANVKMSPGRVATAQRGFIDEQRPNFDVILLDTAPLLSTSDPIDIVGVADFVLLVGRPGQTERDHARQAMELLQRHRASVAGVLMTAVDPVGSEYYYYYSSYSSYAAAPPPVDAEAAAPVDSEAVPDVATATVSTVDLPHPKKRHARRRRRMAGGSSDDD